MRISPSRIAQGQFLKTDIHTHTHTTLFTKAWQIQNIALVTGTPKPNTAHSHDFRALFLASCYWLQTSRRFCGVLRELILHNRHSTHVRIRPKGLLYDAGCDLLAIAKFLVNGHAASFVIIVLLKVSQLILGGIHE